jgi:sensor histidine kinase regulating citrate/malate metabolism
LFEPVSERRNPRCRNKICEFYAESGDRNSTKSISSNYHLTALQQGVKVEVSGYCKEEILISNIDLCTIFANLIQNSVEELNRESSGENYLKVAIKSGKDYMQIEILNSLSNKSFRKNDLLKTDKNDKQNHGLGLGNVKQTVERNGGKFEIKVTDKEFVASVILKNQREN